MSADQLAYVTQDGTVRVGLGTTPGGIALAWGPVHALRAAIRARSQPGHTSRVHHLPGFVNGAPPERNANAVRMFRAALARFNPSIKATEE